MSTCPPASTSHAVQASASQSLGATLAEPGSDTALNSFPFQKSTAPVSCQMAPCCKKPDCNPSKSTAVPRTLSLPSLWFISAVSSSRQKDQCPLKSGNQLYGSSTILVLIEFWGGWQSLLQVLGQPDLPPMLLLTVQHSDLLLILLFSRQENELTWHTAQQSTKGQQEKSHTFLPSGQSEPTDVNSGDRECFALKASNGAILGSNQITSSSNKMSAGTRHLQSISLMEVSDW